VLAAGLAALMAGVTLVLAGPGNGATAAPPVAVRGKPNLGVAEILAVPSQARAGGTFAVKVLVDNLGKARAPSSLVSLHLSRDATKSGGDLPVGRAPVSGMDPWQVRTASGRIAVPDWAQGKYFVIACADAARKVAESRERDNCGTSREKVRIVRPVNGLLVGTLDLYDSGDLDGGTWTKSWERYAQANITMTVRGPSEDVAVRDDGGGYSWMGQETTVVPDPDCPTTKTEDEEMVGLFQYDGQPVSALTGRYLDEVLQHLQVEFTMEYAVKGSITGPCIETQHFDVTVEQTTLVDLRQVSRDDDTIHYVVESSSSQGEASPWDTIDGTLELRLD
jgi:hypothetical protein